MTSEGKTRVLGEATEDATMTDVGDRTRPPRDPPDGTGTWAMKVRGTNAGGMPTPESLIDDMLISERLNVEFPEGEDGEPVITIGREVIEAMNGMWKRCMIVKVLGRHISMPILSRKLREMWKPKGDMHVIDLPRQFFIVRFELEEEYLEALTGGPWKAFGSYLMVQAWSPDFDPLRHEITTTPVWVRLTNIPVTFYHRAILMGIAKGLGKPVKVDLTTLNFERARFARVCVEVNLAKPLKGTILINEDRYFVSYEGLATICSGCGLYGHLIHACPKAIEDGARTQGSQRRVEEPAMPTMTGNPTPRGTETGFTVVHNTRRRAGNPPSQVVANGTTEGRQTVQQRNALENIPQDQIRISNRFGELGLDTDLVESGNIDIPREVDKENINNQNIQGEGGRVEQEGRVEQVTFGSQRGKLDKRKAVKKVRPKERWAGKSQRSEGRSSGVFIAGAVGVIAGDGTPTSTPTGQRESPESMVEGEASEEMTGSEIWPGVGADLTKC
ncbi:unnamed protein product [Microthlaspi erraticum]|uniref:DUF4283 domain-containing protein n=1 Tax=Microthlaspi erraticum TaxID=1685480 RepID=A0A6D2IIS3_9BRAS|nr:unnamed protein product [Microthlaspi erraticum]